MFVYQRGDGTMNFPFQNARFQPRIRLQVSSVEAKSLKGAAVLSTRIYTGDTGALGWAGTSWEFSSLRDVHVIKVSPFYSLDAGETTSISKSSMNLETIFAWNAFWEVLLPPPQYFSKEGPKNGRFGIQDGDFHHLKAGTFAGVLGRNPGQKVREPSVFFLRGG